MNEDNMPGLAKCLELIKGLERQNEIQEKLIKLQSDEIRTLEKYNADLEKILSDLTKV